MEGSFPTSNKRDRSLEQDSPESISVSGSSRSNTNARENGEAPVWRRCIGCRAWTSHEFLDCPKMKTCSNCLQRDHPVKDCTNPRCTAVCVNCGGANHLSKACMEALIARSWHWIKPEAEVAKVIVNEKLYGNDYVKWKSIVYCMECAYAGRVILHEDCPDFTAHHQTPAEPAVFETWRKFTNGIYNVE